MLLTLLKAKIHRATVTQADLHYEGSVTIDAKLLKQSGILVHEQVHVFNITNGQRFVTYAIEGEAGSGTICINGAAARLVAPGDLVIIAAYAQFNEDEAHTHEPRVLLVDAKNRVKKASRKSGHQG